MPKPKVSEYRLYPLIKKRLEDMGWCIKSPINGGQVYEQNEVLRNPALKKALGRHRPEMVVDLGSGRYWVIEAKADEADLDAAMKQAQAYARKINDVPESVNCLIITGIAGNADVSYRVETQCWVGDRWKTLSINKRKATGFLSREQVDRVLLGNAAALDEYEIDDKLFSSKMQEINRILHRGAISQKNRAQVLACILLALANDPQMRLSPKPTVLIQDINGRAKEELNKHGKENFYGEIKINRPTSSDNHHKNRSALSESIVILRDLNITSAINSGRDVLGQCYEQFLKYANDAKEIGIVLTPRTITNFAADVVGVERNDRVYDPTCGTGGFLVAALDKVRRDGGNIDRFKKGNLHGVEQDPLVTTLAIVNMVFRGDGSSNIKEGNCLVQSYADMDKVLMNPPFAIEQECEWMFVDHALKSMREGGLLFSVVPTGVMNSMNNKRGELAWRQRMLESHSLLSVIKMPEDLFYPHVSKGTYGVIIRAHIPHDFQYRIVWAVLHDGVARTKTVPAEQSNMDKVADAIKNRLASERIPGYSPGELDCVSITPDDRDLSPELYIGRGRGKGVFNISRVMADIRQGEIAIESHMKKGGEMVDACAEIPLTSFFTEIVRGKSGRNKNLPRGDLPLISTSERSNGISAMVDRKAAEKIYSAGGITISSNGGACYAQYHDYKFAANADVYVCRPKEQFSDRSFCLFLCAAINSESWRYNYFRKFNQQQLDVLKIKIPVKGGDIAREKILRMVDASVGTGR